MTQHYIALIHKDAESGYGVSFPDVPGVTAVADTLDDALREAGIALGFAFEDRQRPWPASRTLDDLRGEPEFLDWSRGAVVAAVAPVMGIARAA